MTNNRMTLKRTGDRVTTKVVRKARARIPIGGTKHSSKRVRKEEKERKEEKKAHRRKAVRALQLPRRNPNIRIRTPLLPTTTIPGTATLGNPG